MENFLISLQQLVSQDSGILALIVLFMIAIFCVLGLRSYRKNQFPKNSISTVKYNHIATYFDKKDISRKSY